MMEEKKTTKLTDTQIEQISGGDAPAKIEYKYHIDQIVFNKLGWKLRIIELYGWSNRGNCPYYNTVILEREKPRSFRDWHVGDEYVVEENYIDRVDS